MPRQLTRSTARGHNAATASRAARDVPIQTGALPWRVSTKKGIEVLLVTGRRSGRWGIPKGWPIPGKSLAEAAAEEAFEEAGVRGTVDPKPLGAFRHIKQQFLIGDLEVNIVVHPLWVDREFSTWPELGQRERKWFSAREAARRVDSPELSELIRQSAKSSRSQ